MTDLDIICIQLTPISSKQHLIMEQRKINTHLILGHQSQHFSHAIGIPYSTELASMVFSILNWREEMHSFLPHGPSGLWYMAIISICLSMLSFNALSYQSISGKWQYITIPPNYSPWGGIEAYQKP